MQKGNIGVTSQDIFPMIKKFMYNDQDIFIREIVSNAVDATQKLITIVNSNEYSTNIEYLKINVILDQVEKTITVSDRGIGMTEEEIENYINRIAFSGANDFLEKYKDANIIGHFGLGFYSSFMVSDKVEIITTSYKEPNNTYKWSCSGTTEYEIDKVTDDKEHNVGTDIVMHLNDEYLEYLDVNKMKSLLTKYSKYVPVEINLINYPAPEKDPSTGEDIKPDNTSVTITSDNALWTKTPSELTDDDYIKFYKELYPRKPDPLFWIHINIDTPFTFKGILYFPAFDPAKPVLERKNLSLYCNRVFVTDDVDDILPAYLGLLHGVIDSPDIPLNVSRSFLQSDSNVKKISSHITSKVMSSLKTLMDKDRAKYEEKWETIKTFINLGVITVPDLFKKAKDIILLTDIDNNKYAFDEYFDKVSETQKDKNGKIIYLYTYETDTQYTYIQELKKFGYNILLFNGHYAAFEVQAFEVENNSRNVEFRRIDSKTPNELIEKEDTTAKKSTELSENLKSMLISLFNATNREFKNIKHSFAVNNAGKDALPIVITSDEWFRRMKEMSTLNNGGLYINEKATITFVINSDAKVVKKILKNAEKALSTEINEINEKIKELNKVLEDNTDNDEITKQTKDEIDNIINNKEKLIKEYAVTDHHINELIDIALLQNGILQGEDLSNFIWRSIKMIEK